MMEFVKFREIAEVFSRGKFVKSHSISVIKQKYQEVAPVSKSEVSLEEVRELQGRMQFL